MRYAMYMGLLAAYIITVDFVQVFNFCFLLYLSPLSNKKNDKKTEER